MQISISNSRSGYPLYYRTLEIRLLSTIASAVTSAVWSPIVWKDGRRNTENFSHADYLGLDFDGGPSIETVRRVLVTQNLRAIIGTTKSHQLSKSGLPPCDRFRVVMPWSSRITDYKTYRQNLERLSRMLPGDEACRDGARIFQPCTKIEHVLAGNGYEWAPYHAPSESRYAPSDHYKKNGIIPAWVRDMIDNPPGAGGRNKHCFRIAAALSNYGFSERDCFGAVLSCAVDLTEREKMSAAKSGFKAGKK